MKKSTITQVPIDHEGNWLSYPQGTFDGVRRRGPYWTDVTTFHAWMEIVDMYTGRSAKGLVVRDKNTGREYNMFVSDFIKTVGKVTIVKGAYQPMTWTAAKRGSNYGIKPVV